MEVQIKGIEDIVMSVERMIGVNNLESAVGKACELVEGDAKEVYVPKGETGNLGNSMGFIVENKGSVIEGTVYNTAEYAPYVEYGTGCFSEKGGGPSGYWIYVKDGGSSKKRVSKRYPFWLAKKIVAKMREEGLDAYYTNGQKPHPFLRPALNANKDNIVTIIKGGINK